MHCTRLALNISTFIDRHNGGIDAALKSGQEIEKLPDGLKVVVTGGFLVHIPGSSSVLEVREMRFR